MTAAIRTVVAAWRRATARHFVWTFVLALAWSVVTIATVTSFLAQNFLTPG